MLTRLVAFGLGGASVVAFAPFSFTGFTWLTLAGLFLLWCFAPTPRLAAWQGFAFGLGFFGVGVSWLFVALHQFGGMPAVLAVLAIALFCAFLALFPAAAGYAFGRWRGRHAAINLVVLAPAVWTLCEWSRGWIFTGFPWLSLGYAELPASPLLGLAPLLGVYGLSLAVGVIAGVLAWLIVGEPGPRRRALPAPLVALLALLSSGVALRGVEWSEPTGEPLRVALLQGNIAQNEKFDGREFRRTLETYLRLARESDARLIITPESAVPALLDDAPPLFLELLEEHARKQGADVLLGVFSQDPLTRAFHNSVFSFGVSPTQSYQKVHLVPFGESIPLKPLLGWVFQHLLSIPIDDQGRGSTRQRPLAVAGQRVAVNICYEDVFGEEIIRLLPEATLLVNVTNDAWYGRSIAARQHNQIAQMRALETARVLLRATNTGVTTVIDAHGQVLSSLPEFTVGRLEATVQGRRGSTPYVFWGNWLVVSLAVLLLLGARFAHRSK
ncbi:MAG: apolipoprotein N-acyltransferase [Betaproteobacteria bacterium]|nr:apolipoprotein N-acyltransferase [Betaproteobacteria bacterium]